MDAPGLPADAEESVPSLVGRSAELALLEQALQAALTGHMQVVLVEGEPGIGKSALLAHLAASAAERGCSVLRVAHDALDYDRPFGGFLDALGLTPAAAIGGQVLIDLGAPGEESRRPGNVLTFVPELRYHVTERVGAHLEARAGRGPLVILVDDVHVADPPTIQLLGSLARQMEGLPVLLTAATRRGTQRDDVDALRSRVLKQGGLVLSVSPLDDDAVGALVRSILDDDPSPSLRAELRGAAGNPLLIKELLAAGPPVGFGADEGGRSLPRPFRELVLARLRPLSSTLLRSLELAAVLGNAFTLEELAALAGVTSTTAWHELRPAVAGGFVEEDDEGLVFRHDLVRSAIYETIPGPVRAALHLDAARKLAGLCRSAARVAGHYVLAGELADAESVFWLRRAAREQIGHDPARALNLLERAVTRCPAHDPNRALLDADRVYALSWTNRFTDAIELARNALAVTDHVAGRTGLRLSLASALLGSGRATEAAATLTEIFEGEPAGQVDDATRALGASLAGLSFLLAARMAEADSWAAHGVDLGRKVREPVALSVGLSVRARVKANALDFSASRPLAEAAVHAAARDRSGAARGYLPPLFAALSAFDDEDDDALHRYINQGRTEAEAIGLAWALPAYQGLRADWLRLRGLFDDARAEAQAGLAIAEETGSGIGAAFCAAVLLDIHVRQGDLEAGRAASADAARWSTAATGAFGFDAVVVGRARLALASGDVEGATTELWAMWSVSVSEDLPIFATTLLLPLIRLLVTQGDVARTAQVLATVDGWSDRSALSRSSQLVARVRHARGLAGKDLGLLESGLELSRNRRDRILHADAVVDVARLATSQGRPDLVRGLVNEARSIYEAAGAHGDLLDLAAVSRQAGIRGPRGRPATRPVTGWESLSPAELAVADLVARGLTNREAAGELYLSPRTVETHLHNIFAKLGVGSRRELARRVAARQSGA